MCSSPVGQLRLAESWGDIGSTTVTNSKLAIEPVAASTHGQVTGSACEVSSPCSRQQPRTLSRTITEAFQGIVRRHREAILLPGSQRTSSKHRSALLEMSLRLHHKCCLSLLIAGASGDVTSLRKASSPADRVPSTLELACFAGVRF